MSFAMPKFSAEWKGNLEDILPELGLTGYTCGDLFSQDALIRGAEEALATAQRSSQISKPKVSSGKSAQEKTCPAPKGMASCPRRAR